MKNGRPTKDEGPRPTTSLRIRLDEETRLMLDELVGVYTDKTVLQGQGATVVRKLIREEHQRVFHRR